MTKIKALKEFTDKDIKAVSEHATDDKARKKAHRFKMEMLAYNARALRGDFDRY